MADEEEKECTHEEDSTDDNYKTSADNDNNTSQTFVIDWGSDANTNATSLQEAFMKFRKGRQDDIRQARKMEEKLLEEPGDTKRMERLRTRFLEQAKKYIGVPYARKYWAPDTPEYKSPFFLDCCGLVRRVLKDLSRDFGFRIGPWNQAYMFDTLPVTVEREEDMKPGDLVFISGKYNNPKSKPQRHDMTHVEIWYGEGPKTIGARWNNGKVQVWDHYKFSAKSFHSEQYHFKSIDAWLKGVCRSFCPEHKWRTCKYDPSKRSIFNPQQQQKEGEEGEEEEERACQSDDEMADPGPGQQQQQQQQQQKAKEAEAKRKEELAKLKVVGTNMEYSCRSRKGSWQSSTPSSLQASQEFKISSQFQLNEGPALGLPLPLKLPDHATIQDLLRQKGALVQPLATFRPEQVVQDSRDLNGKMSEQVSLNGQGALQAPEPQEATAAAAAAAPEASSPEGGGEYAGKEEGAVLGSTCSDENPVLQDAIQVGFSGDTPSDAANFSVNQRKVTMGLKMATLQKRGQVSTNSIPARHSLSLESPGDGKVLPSRYCSLWQNQKHPALSNPASKQSTKQSRSILVKSVANSAQLATISSPASAEKFPNDCTDSDSVKEGVVLGVRSLPDRALNLATRESVSAGNTGDMPSEASHFSVNLQKTSPQHFPALISHKVDGVTSSSSLSACKSAPKTDKFRAFRFSAEPVPQETKTFSQGNEGNRSPKKEMGSAALDSSASVGNGNEISAEPDSYGHPVCAGSPLGKPQAQWVNYINCREPSEDVPGKKTMEKCDEEEDEYEHLQSVKDSRLSTPLGEINASPSQSLDDTLQSISTEDVSARCLPSPGEKNRDRLFQKIQAQYGDDNDSSESRKAGPSSPKNIEAAKRNMSSSLFSLRSLSSVDLSSTDWQRDSDCQMSVSMENSVSTALPLSTESSRESLQQSHSDSQLLVTMTECSQEEDNLPMDSGPWRSDSTENSSSTAAPMSTASSSESQQNLSNSQLLITTAECNQTEECLQSDDTEMNDCTGECNSLLPKSLDSSDTLSDQASTEPLDASAWEETREETQKREESDISSSREFHTNSPMPLSVELSEAVCCQYSSRSSGDEKTEECTQQDRFLKLAGDAREYSKMELKASLDFFPESQPCSISDGQTHDLPIDGVPVSTTPSTLEVALKPHDDESPSTCFEDQGDRRDPPDTFTAEIESEQGPACNGEIPDTCHTSTSAGPERSCPAEIEGLESHVDELFLPGDSVDIETSTEEKLPTLETKAEPQKNETVPQLTKRRESCQALSLTESEYLMIEVAGDPWDLNDGDSKPETLLHSDAVDTSERHSKYFLSPGILPDGCISSPPCRTASECCFYLEDEYISEILNDLVRPFSMPDLRCLQDFGKWQRSLEEVKAQFQDSAPPCQPKIWRTTCFDLVQLHLGGKPAPGQNEVSREEMTAVINYLKEITWEPFECPLHTRSRHWEIVYKRYCSALEFLKMNIEEQNLAFLQPMCILKPPLTYRTREFGIYGGFSRLIYPNPYDMQPPNFHKSKATSKKAGKKKSKDGVNVKCQISEQTGSAQSLEVSTVSLSLREEKTQSELPQVKSLNLSLSSPSKAQASNTKIAVPGKGEVKNPYATWGFIAGGRKLVQGSKDKGLALKSQPLNAGVIAGNPLKSPTRSAVKTPGMRKRCPPSQANKSKLHLQTTETRAKTVLKSPTASCNEKHIDELAQLRERVLSPIKYHGHMHQAGLSKERQSKAPMFSDSYLAQTGLRFGKVKKARSKGVSSEKKKSVSSPNTSGLNPLCCPKLKSFYAHDTRGRISPMQNRSLIQAIRQDARFLRESSNQLETLEFPDSGRKSTDCETPSEFKFPLSSETEQPLCSRSSEQHDKAGGLEEVVCVTEDTEEASAPTDADTKEPSGDNPTPSDNGSGNSGSGLEGSGGDEGGQGEASRSGKKGGAAGGPGEGGGGGRKRPTKLPSCSLPSNMQPTFFIGGGNGVSLVEAPLLALGWKRINDKHDERYKLKWVECKGKINYTSFREGDQLANHIPNGYLLTNKLGLTNSLQEYERVSILTKGRPPKLRIADFLPITYRLDDKNDREAFLQAYKEGETWICKPTGMNQGKGIFLLRNLEEINQLISERDVRQRTTKPTRPLMSRIVQKYISNPLLLDDRKFDIRTYMLIASTVPYCVLYHKGYVRLSCTKFDNEDPNLITHLTNQFVQKKDPRYKDVKEDTAWSMDKLNAYINENFMEEKGLERDWVYNTLTKQMQRIIYHCFNSVRHKLQCKIGYFDLYGLDFMIDTDMKVWLIEVNVNPALHVNCEALREVIPGVVEETLYLAIECFEKSRRSQPLLPLQSLKKFTLLHCSVTPNAVVPRHPHPRSISPSKEPQPDRSKGSQTAPARRTASPGRPAARPGTLSSGSGSSSHNSAASGSQGPTRRSEMGLALKGAEPAASATQSQMWKPGASNEEPPSKSHSESTSARPRETRARQAEATKPRSSGAVRKSSEEGGLANSSGNRAPPQPLNLTLPMSQGAKAEETSSVKLKMTHGAPTSGRRRELSDRGN